MVVPLMFSQDHLHSLLVVLVFSTLLLIVLLLLGRNLLQHVLEGRLLGHAERVGLQRSLDAIGRGVDHRFEWHAVLGREMLDFGGGVGRVPGRGTAVTLATAIKLID